MNLLLKPLQVPRELRVVVAILINLLVRLAAQMGFWWQPFGDPRGDRDNNVGGFGRAPVVVKPEGAEDELLAHLLLLVVGEEVINVGLVSLEDFDDCGFDFGKCANDAAQVGDYEGVDEALQLHGA
ncbi:hypothetical protein E2542_SST24797 [Spatholobus suberectus]|nr:hypothetical protein E2542_SST24797 [Spatholobus suberectus]